MTISPWSRAIIDEKHSSVMRWVTTTVAETDSKIALAQLLGGNVLTQQVANFLSYELKGATASTVTELELSLDQISKHLLTAFERTYAFLIAPEKFLADFFASIQGATLDETFVQKPDVFETYEYFPLILKEWAAYQRLQGTGFVSRTELVVKLHEIDQLILRHATISVMVDLLDPLYDFHRHRSGDPELPGEELARYFEDKGITQAVHEFTGKQDSYFTLREAVEIISSLLGTGLTVSEVPEAIAAPIQTEYPETHYDAFLHDLQEAGVNMRTPAEHERSPLPSVELFISTKLRERTIRDVFHGNRAEYDRFLSFLNSSRNLDKAMLNLNTTLKLQRVDATSKLARRLREATVLRFHQYQS
jgi:hypothetical protein